MFGILITLYVWNICHKFYNTGCSPQVFSNRLTLKMDPLLSTVSVAGYYAYEALLWCQSMFFITLVGIFRDFSLFIQHPILIIIFETCTQIYWLRGHRLMWEYTENLHWKLLGNQQKTLIFISFTNTHYETNQLKGFRSNGKAFIDLPWAGPIWFWWHFWKNELLKWHTFMVSQC